jgi:RimJ/RimL family protein N-acetyltransferase
MKRTPEPHVILNIIGERVALGPTRPDLLPLYMAWENDFEVTLLDMGMPKPWSQPRFEAAAAEARSSGEERFLIYERAAMRPIGTTVLSGIDFRSGTADFGICIGEKECWGKGYGTEATRLTLDYGFTALGLHNIMLAVAGYNERAIRTYQRAGFREMGRRREACRLRGQPYDVVFMDCLASDFQSPVLHAVVAPP